MWQVGLYHPHSTSLLCDYKPRGRRAQKTTTGMAITMMEQSLVSWNIFTPNVAWRVSGEVRKTNDRKATDEFWLTMYASMTGFEISTLLCLNPSLTFFFYQAFRRIFLRGNDRLQPSPRQAFFGAAVSNVIGMCHVTYSSQPTPFCLQLERISD